MLQVKDEQVITRGLLEQVPPQSFPVIRSTIDKGTCVSGVNFGKLFTSRQDKKWMTRTYIQKELVPTAEGTYSVRKLLKGFCAQATEVRYPPELVTVTQISVKTGSEIGHFKCANDCACVLDGVDTVRTDCGWDAVLLCASQGTRPDTRTPIG